MATRRLLLVTIGAAMLGRPLAAWSQAQPKIRRVGFLAWGPRPDQSDADGYGGFSRGMRELGYVEGKNLVIEWRFANGNAEDLPALSADLVRSNVEVIIATSTPVTHALQKATGTLPIVMTTVADPLGSGFIKSLAKPGGNITGLTNMLVDISGKHLEMLRSVTPRLARMAVLVNPDNASTIETFNSVRQVGHKVGVQTFRIEARTAQQIEDAFKSMARESAQALLLAQDSLFVRQRGQIAELALKHRLPTIGSSEAFTEAGILFSYGPNRPDIYRRAATYVDKILKGAKAGELPVEQPTRFDLAVNMKTAQAIGISLPPEITVRVERFIR